MSSRIRPSTERNPVLGKRSIPTSSPLVSDPRSFMRPIDHRSAGSHLKRPQDDDDALKYGLKYKEAKLTLKSAQESYSDAQQQLERAHKTITRLRARNSLLLSELSNELARQELAVSNFKAPSSSRVSKAPLVDKDGFAIPSLPHEPTKPPQPSKPSQGTTVGRPGSKLSRRSRRDLTQARRVQPVPQDETGKYILPVNIGILTVVSLGTIEYENPKFHNDRYIWPVGYTVKRYYNSTVHPDKQACYTASIVNDNGSPCFQILADDTDEAICGVTATGAWTTVVKLANKIRSRNHSNSASGPDYYGFSHPTIAKMIQDLPNSRRCHKYNWQDFEMMDPKHVPTRKWHVPPADDSVPRAPASAQAGSGAQPNNRPNPTEASPHASTSSSTQHKYELDDVKADKLLSQSDSSPEGGARAPSPRASDADTENRLSEPASSSPISEGDFVGAA